MTNNTRKKRCPNGQRYDPKVERCMPKQLNLQEEILIPTTAPVVPETEILPVPKFIERVLVLLDENVSADKVNVCKEILPVVKVVAAVVVKSLPSGQVTS